jgi:hypothetical protein
MRNFGTFVGRGIKLLNTEECIEYCNKHYGGAKRAGILKGLESIQSEDLNKQDFGITAFVKMEFLKPTKYPRIIQYRGDTRNARVMASMGLPMKEMEHKIYNVERMCNPMAKHQEVAKTMAPQQRADHIVKIIEELREGVVYMLDCSYFDAHISEYHLRGELCFYQNSMKQMGCSSDKYNKFTEAFRWQIYNKCRATCKDGRVYYNVTGNRMSGSWETSIGNIINALAMLRAIMDELTIPFSSWRVFDDGDDMLLFVTYEYANKVTDSIELLFSDLGQDVKVDGIVDFKNVEQIEFCQNRLLRTENGVTMSRDPTRVLTRFLRPLKNFSSKIELLRYLKANAYANYFLYPQVPIISRFFYEVFHACKVFGWERTLLDLERRSYRMLKTNKIKIELPSIEVITRLSYEKAYNISPLSQINVEEEMSDLREIILRANYDQGQSCENKIFHNV